jgi:hypothetical protein
MIPFLVYAIGAMYWYNSYPNICNMDSKTKKLIMIGSLMWAPLFLARQAVHPRLSTGSQKPYKRNNTA